MGYPRAGVVRDGPGRYLASVAERDIDLLLMEEFHISPAFVEWFCGRLGIRGAVADGAWHSWSDSEGETDLFLRVTVGQSRIGVLIENKIAAREQDEQAARYIRRASRGIESGVFNQYVTAICAPTRYLEGLPKDSPYQGRIAYEEIAGWFAKHDDQRSAWRRRVLEEAIEQGRRGYTMLVNRAITAFQEDYWHYLRANHPRLLMAKPTPKGNRSNWIVLKALGFPRGVQLHHKLEQRFMELGFPRTSVEQILAVQPERPQGIELVQKGRSASLAISVPPVDVTGKFEEQTSSVETGLQAAYRLIPFASLLVDAKQ
jgi:hypothetical protein